MKAAKFFLFKRVWMESEDLLLTENQAAKRLNISGKTLSKIRKRGEIAFLQIGRAIRYDVQSIAEWIMRTRIISAA